MGIDLGDVDTRCGASGNLCALFGICRKMLLNSNKGGLGLSNPRPPMFASIMEAGGLTRARPGLPLYCVCLPGILAT